MPNCPDCNDIGVTLVPGVVDIDGTQDWVDIPCPKGCPIEKNPSVATGETLISQISSEKIKAGCALREPSEPKCELCKGTGVIQSLYHIDIPCPFCASGETLTAWQSRLRARRLNGDNNA